MGGPLHSRRESHTSSYTTATRSISDSEYFETDLDWPFGKIDGLDRDDLREAAYEIFFTACRSSPGFGGKNALSYYPAAQDSGEGVGSSNSSSSSSGGGGIVGSRIGLGPGLVGMSRLKRALGLKTMKRLVGKKNASSSSNPSSPGANGIVTPSQLRLRRPLTSAEIMRQQMRVSELSDNRLRKTLMRTLVGQMGRRAETIILPLELLRHLKPSEFSDAHEYHFWQKRQLKILEVGLVLYPSIPVDKGNTHAMHLRDIIEGTEMRAIDTGKNSETMRTLCNSVVSLSWRSSNGSPADVCHWADGYPINIHIYISLLYSIFDSKDDTLVLDEIDELLELMKKTWSTLGLNRMIHNVCFTWVLFQQYVATAQVEQDLLCASLAMLAEITNDLKKVERDPIYTKILSSALGSMQTWSDQRLLDYHECFQKENIGLMENLLPLALSAARILEEDLSNLGVIQEQEDVTMDAMGNRVDFYIRSSLRNAFAKILETVANDMTIDLEEEVSEALLQLAKETEELAAKEKEIFSPMLKRWHPIAAGVAAMTIHNCYGVVLKQYLGGVSTLTNEAIKVLQSAGKLEKDLVQMVIEDSADCEDGGKAIIREMVPYEVDSTILSLLKTWISERFKRGRERVDRAKETETWNPKSKTEPYAQSAVEIMRLAQETVDDFFEIPIDITDDLVQDLADGLELLVQDYISFVASCGSKHNYIPPLPTLTRCNHDSKFVKLWKKAAPCKNGVEDSHRNASGEGNHPRPSTSRGTQRLYIRLNTLHYVLSHLHSLDKSLSVSLRENPAPRTQFSNSTSYFDLARSSIQAATLNISEVAGYRLIFLDSSFVLYNSLYEYDVANSRIRPALRTLKQNLTLLAAILTDRAQPLAVKAVMKATFEAYLMVLLAGGGSRTFSTTDHEMIEEDFDSLKRVFCSCGEGVIAEEVVDRETETVEGVVALMGQSTEQLMEDFSIMACEVSGLGVVGAGAKVPMPPTTGRWNRADPNTILRVLCHRDDRLANHFLKRTFQLAKRR
ncbi:hypothetical protein GIB67_030238 [Kingdonia uniflora]|uniref:Uncharacterized protein n=1 Tax=Kingdonia uniflora TaxID=39325 RepID=A0A7J7MMQ0_9MAGN|nr:hypothetical protein GIB67_030238 [Kingdonia uniflora]